MQEPLSSKICSEELPTEHAELPEITFVVPYPPSANHYKNHRVIPASRGKKAMVITYVDDVAKRFRTDVAVLARQAGVRKTKGRVRVFIRLFPHRPLDWARRARKDPDFWDDTVQCIDVGNTEKCILDGLNGTAWDDDKQVRSLAVDRECPDEHGARCIVTITPIRKLSIAPSLL